MKKQDSLHINRLAKLYLEEFCGGDLITKFQAHLKDTTV